MDLSLEEDEVVHNTAAAGERRRAEEDSPLRMSDWRMGAGWLEGAVGNSSVEVGGSTAALVPVPVLVEAAVAAAEGWQRRAVEHRVFVLERVHMVLHMDPGSYSCMDNNPLFGLISIRIRPRSFLYSPQRDQPCL